MKPLLIAAALLTVLLTALTFYYRSEPNHFYGIADTKEIEISSQSPVEVRRIWVTQGQVVRQGDTLIELHDPDLELKINQITNELSVLKTRRSAHATLSRSEIRQLQAQQQEKVSEIRAELRELEAQYNLNRQLVSELRSLSKNGEAAKPEADASNPIKIKIESLKKMLEMAQDPSRVYVDRLSHALSSSGDPIIEQAERLEEELGLLLEDKKRLVIPAQMDGLIGSVNFRVGEKVSPFAPILSLHAASPSFVRGYIHEDVMSQVGLSQVVTVRSSHDKGNALQGKIIGVGARIVEYPERLRRRADIVIWGREIMVQLPPENRFLLGEKVLITLSDGKPLFAPDSVKQGGMGLPERASGREAKKETSMVDAGPATNISSTQTAMAGILTIAGDTPNIEASGLLFLKDLEKFAVVSDESKGAPKIHLMDTAGKIEKSLAIRGLDDMDDIEAIADDSANHLYLLSSQSFTKKGKHPDKRKLLVRLARKGEDLELQGKVRLFQALEDVTRLNPGEEWAPFLREAMSDKTIDMEGMTFHEGGLLLGFKAPLMHGKAVILKLNGLGGLFSGKPIHPQDLSLWRTLDLKNPQSGAEAGIADLHKVGDDLFVLSSGGGEGNGGLGGGGHVGDLWSYRLNSAKLEFKHNFSGMKPEGLAWHDPSQKLYVAFDNGGEHPSQFMKIGVRP